MKYLKGFYMGLGMFMAVPLPFFIWEKSLTPIMIASLPMIGLLIGVLWWGLSFVLLNTLPFPMMLATALVCVFPLLLTGFIHLDGFMDTTDARLSRRELEEKKRILKDPNVGAFAVCALMVVMLINFSALYTVLTNARQLIRLFILIPVLSRGLGAISLASLKPMGSSGYGASLGSGIGALHKIFMSLVMLGFTGILYLYEGNATITTALVMGLTHVLVLRRVYKEFGGISGDLIGYTLVLTELTGVIMVALMGVVWF